MENGLSETTKKCLPHQNVAGLDIYTSISLRL